MKKKIAIVFFTILLTVLFSFVVFGSSCGTITTNTTMNESIFSVGTCYSIGANDVILDCAGFTINYSTGGITGFSVNASNFNSTTIKNCIIVKGNVSGDETYGINVYNATNSTIQNNTITTTGDDSYGIYIGELVSNSPI